MPHRGRQQGSDLRGCKKCRGDLLTILQSYNKYAIPAKAGIQGSAFWIPAFAGMTLFSYFFTRSKNHYIERYNTVPLFSVIGYVTPLDIIEGR